MNNHDNTGEADAAPLPSCFSGETELPDWREIRFHGSGPVYFRIWLVNLVLTLLTLGIYSAWATVRQRRYLYGCTEVAGSRFDFHGRPLQILVGRIVAVALLLAWTQGHLIHVGVQYGALAIVLCLFPWFLVNAMRFRLRNTSLRNLRFNFEGGPGGAYQLLGKYLVYAALLMAALGGFTFLTFDGLTPDQMSGGMAFQTMARFMLVYLLVMLAFAFMFPAFICDLRNYTVNHTTYGDHPFSVNLRKGDFIQFFWGAIGISFVTSAVAVFIITVGVVSIGFVAGLGEGGPSPVGIFGGIFASYFLLGLSFTLAVAFWQVKTFNLLYNQARLEQVEFRSDLRVMPLTRILVGNMLLVIVTLGLGYPWAVVRLLRYKLEAVSYRGDPDQFAGPATSPQSALGDEVGQAFDFDFGFG